mmetsp:Transcript_42105/g.64576  ORF Transcript_42105/g.64576 Transcript_42105/m.64576 type:complete len:209 (-) Transcript_42105:1238-1864(-)|eukprot:CAMPEP_0170507268 /NCGR_PEP_ID=MMETSP0208-20121228/58282_1 /TAXON_ID=197538 /ORGANISM="Strombidium inclinatum, Strain S3" /LENGTH=208 /DNA_ID=CAMNT_0010789339 /DNA_START=414 /DNA_END=1040 /DNA_ORIENTATION=-
MDLYRDSVPIADSTARQSPFQYLLDQIVSSMMEDSTRYLGSNFRERIASLDLEQRKTYIERKLRQRIQLKEIDILNVNEWNLRLSNGYDIMSLLLKYCNESYNFKNIVLAVSELSTDHIFKRKLLGKKSFMSSSRQSSIYLAYFKLVCSLCSWDDFYQQFIEFTKDFHFSMFIDIEEANSICQAIEADLAATRQAADVCRSFGIKVTK